MKAGTDFSETTCGFADFHVTVRGAAHRQKGTGCQDFSCSACFGDCAAAVVADGHGDVRYFRSAFGAHFAAVAALGAVRTFLKREGPDDISGDTQAKFVQLKKNIILNWNRKVAAHYASHPFTEEELSPLSEHRRKLLQDGKLVETAYGTTLIAAAATPSFWFGLQIGDGDCFGISGDQKLFVPKEDGLIGNLTTSLCEPDAYYKFHHVFRREKPSAVVLSTDGVRNSFSSGAYYENFMGRVADEFSVGAKKRTQTALSEFLSEMTGRGSGDDLSVAGIATVGISESPVLGVPYAKAVCAGKTV